MTTYAQHDPRMVCLDCYFLTYSTSAAASHEIAWNHVVIEEES
jgi:hypothetical protein